MKYTSNQNHEYKQDHLRAECNPQITILLTFSTAQTEVLFFLQFFLQIIFTLAALAQMVARLPLVQQARASIPGGVVNFNLKILNLG